MRDRSVWWDLLGESWRLACSVWYLVLIRAVGLLHRPLGPSRTARVALWVLRRAGLADRA